MREIEIGRLLRASTTACVVGCRVSQANVPAFGGLVRIPLADGYGIYGLIYDIRIEDDGLVRQLVTAEEIDDDVILDNRVNRNVPVEVSVLHVGYRQNGQIYHLLPPHPPLSRMQFYICGAKKPALHIAGRFGYFATFARHRFTHGELWRLTLSCCTHFTTRTGHCSWASSATQN